MCLIPFSLLAISGQGVSLTVRSQQYSSLSLFLLVPLNSVLRFIGENGRALHPSQ